LRQPTIFTTVQMRPLTPYPPERVGCPVPIAFPDLDQDHREQASVNHDA
jgi:hypothetical protein